MSDQVQREPRPHTEYRRQGAAKPTDLTRVDAEATGHAEPAPQWRDERPDADEDDLFNDLPV